MFDTHMEFLLCGFFYVLSALLWIWTSSHMFCTHMALLLCEFFHVSSNHLFDWIFSCRSYTHLIILPCEFSHVFSDDLIAFLNKVAFNTYNLKIQFSKASMGGPLLHILHYCVTHAIVRDVVRDLRIWVQIFTYLPIKIVHKYCVQILYINKIFLKKRLVHLHPLYHN